MGSAPASGRRGFLVGAMAAVGCAVTAPALALTHLHTGEHLDIVYWANGRYEPGALRHIDWLLRDFRTGDVHPIDPHLLDLLAALHQRLRAGAPIEVYSGYRSP